MNFSTCWAFLLYITITNGNEYFKDGGCYQTDSAISSKGWTFVSKAMMGKIGGATKNKRSMKKFISSIKKVQKQQEEIKTIKGCREKCWKQGSDFAAIQVSGSCSCLNNTPPVSNLMSEEKCSKMCIDNSSLTCGQNVFHSFEDAGCYVEKKEHQKTFWDTKINTTSNTVSTCVERCLTDGYSFAGVSFGKFCSCKNEAPSIERLTLPSECDITCAGDGQQICGGYWRSNIYKTEDYGEGCYKDKNPLKRILDGTKVESNLTTGRGCRETCSELKYVYGGVEHGNICFCGNNRPPIWAKIPLDQCNFKCAGDASQKCGGYFKIKVASTVKNGGCFQQKRSIELFKESSKFTDNSIAKCTSKCKDGNYIYAGVQENSCMCGNIPPNKVAEVNHGNCNETCPGNENETCGGALSINLFLIQITNRKKKKEGQNFQVASTNISLGISVVAVVAIVILIVALMKQKKKLKSTQDQYTRQSFKKLLEGDPMMVNKKMPLSEQRSVLPYDKENFEISKDQIKFDHLLGGGQFGDVYLGMIDGTTVAIKMVKDMNNSSHVSSICDELKVLSNIGIHMNLVNLLYASTFDEICVVLEYCCFGDMKKFLTDNADEFIYNIRKPDHQPENIFTGHLLLKWSYSIAKGMEYLSSKNIMHGDLAARNILLCTNYVPKISDFGLSKVIFYGDDYKKSSRRMIPWAWMAIEYLKTGTFQLKSDVWSFGVVLWEMYSLGGKPYDTQPYETVKPKLINGERLPPPDHMEQLDENEYMYSNVMLPCWEEKIAKRPNFSDVVDLITLNLSKDILQEYKQLTKNFEMIRRQTELMKNQVNEESNIDEPTLPKENKAASIRYPKMEEVKHREKDIEKILKEDGSNYIKARSENGNKIQDDVYEADVDGYIEFIANENEEYPEEVIDESHDAKSNNGDATEPKKSNEYITLIEEAKEPEYTNPSRYNRESQHGYILIQSDSTIYQPNDKIQTDY